jgi:hypothetical protein
MRIPSLALLASVLLGVVSLASAEPVVTSKHKPKSAPTAAAELSRASGKILVGVALPRAQLGQGNGGSADVAEPVRQALIAYLKGPALEVIPLEARIPQQIDAEAQQRGCTFVLYTDVTQTRKRGGLAMLKKLAPVATALPMLGGGGGMGSAGTQIAMQAAAQSAMQSQMQGAQEDAMASAMAAIGGAQKNNVKAGDSLSLEYRLVRPGTPAPFKTDTILGKANANGDDVLTPMIENVAIAVVGAATGG